MVVCDRCGDKVKFQIDKFEDRELFQIEGEDFCKPCAVALKEGKDKIRDELSDLKTQREKAWFTNWRANKDTGKKNHGKP